MASENETVAEIVSEMRRDAIAADAWCETHGEMASAASVLNRHANRIESAHRREVAELREVGKQMLRRWCNMACTCEHCEFNTEPCQRWRKALEGAKDEGK